MHAQTSKEMPVARHAGFGVVASVREGFVNDAIANVFSGELGPFFFPLPRSVPVAGHTVTFGGLAQFAAPTFELHDTPGQVITGHFTFFSTFAAQIDSLPEQRFRVRLEASASGRLILAPQDGEVVLSLDTSTVVIGPLTVTVLQGQPLPAPVQAALESPTLAAAATAIVNSVGVQRIAGLVPTHLTRTQPATFKDSGYSVFNWFTIDLTVSRTVLRILEGAATIAADFAGMTSGDPAQLVDLTSTSGGGAVYVQTITMDTNPNDQPILVPRTYSAASDIAVSFSIDVLSQIVANQITPGVAGTPISKQAVLNWIHAGYSRFEKPLRGWEEGLHFHINATAKGIDADVHVYLQPFLRTYDGPTNFLRNDGWMLFVGRVDVEIPWWAELAIGIAQALSVAIGVVVMIPALINVRGLMPLLTDFFDDINDTFASGDPSNIASATRLTLQGAAYGAALPAARYISVGPDTIDIGRGRGFTTSPATATPGGGAVIAPDRWSADDRAPIRTLVTLDGNWANLSRNQLMAVLEVRRKDTGAVVVSGTRPYNDGQDNGVLISHHTEDLYLVSDYVIRCSLTMLLGTQAGEIWSGQQDLHISDPLDRSHPFVEWGPDYVHFANAGTDNKMWTRLSRSRIHRTAVAARCRMLRKLAGGFEPTGAPAPPPRRNSWAGRLRYKDTLPFPWEQVNDHRTELCEYCFFGGPDKTTPYPQDDWFQPSHFVPVVHVPLTPP